MQNLQSVAQKISKDRFQVLFETGPKSSLGLLILKCIGTRAAPSFAGKFMGELEEKALLAWAEQDPATIPEDWWRFIDDILFWWVGTREDLLTFIEFMNGFHPVINFTLFFLYKNIAKVGEAQCS